MMVFTRDHHNIASKLFKENLIQIFEIKERTKRNSPQDDNNSQNSESDDSESDESDDSESDEIDDYSNSQDNSD